MMIPLSEWAALKYRRPPTQATLCRWVREGQICPPPERAGRLYQVEETAVRIAPGARPSLVQRLKDMEAA